MKIKLNQKDKLKNIWNIFSCLSNNWLILFAHHDTFVFEYTHLHWSIMHIWFSVWYLIVNIMMIDHVWFIVSQWTSTGQGRSRNSEAESEHGGKSFYSLKGPSMQRWQCPIHNGTLKPCIRSKMWKILFSDSKCWFLWIPPLFFKSKKCASHFYREKCTIAIFALHLWFL